MHYVSGTGGYRVQLVVPKDTQQAVDNMRRGGLDADVRKYMRAVLDRVGSAAVIKARGILNLGTAAGLQELTPLTREIRSFTRDTLGGMGQDRPLVDTGQMRDGIRGVVDPAALTMTLGVVGAHAHLARLHEYGYTFKVTAPFLKEPPTTLGHFYRLGSRWAIGWATKNAGETITVSARPFLTPALTEAKADVMSSRDPRFNLARDFFTLWVGGKYDPVDTQARYGLVKGYAVTAEPAQFIKDEAARGGGGDA